MHTTWVSYLVQKQVSMGLKSNVASYRADKQFNVHTWICIQAHADQVSTHKLKDTQVKFYISINTTCRVQACIPAYKEAHEEYGDAEFYFSDVDMNIKSILKQTNWI